MKTYASYFRISTKRQGLEGLGIGSQQDIVRRYIAGQGGVTAGEFLECESGKKTDKDRPQLHAALALCKKTKSVLVVAKLDRLSRNAEFLLSLQNAGVEFVCCDSPNVDKFTVGILALVAQRERELISDRTKAALKVAKARGVRLGCRDAVRSVALMNEGARRAKIEFVAAIRPLILEIQNTGVTTLQGVADCLNRRGIETRTGKQWFPATVRNVLMHKLVMV
jgi:DNA invertase Pin-like site-specific DNA recombinase